MGLQQSLSEYFVQVVRDTAQWCALHANVDDPEHSLRTTELATPTPFDIWYPKTKQHRPMNDQQSFTSFVHQVNTLIDRRRKLLTQQKFSAQPAGRLLIYDPSSSDSSGGSMNCSNGFFDVDDCPPWDTWICAVRSDTHYALQRDDWMPLLICWIPEVFYPLIEKGFNCCTIECIGWIHSSSGPFYGGVPILESLHRQWQEAQT